jgi:hypothetical protein
MAPSLNLSPARGPSTWDRIARDSQRERFGTILLVAGFALVAVGLFVRTAASGRNPFANIAGARAGDDGVDRASADSFPASDPPSIPAPASPR